MNIRNKSIPTTHFHHDKELILVIKSIFSLDIGTVTFLAETSYFHHIFLPINMHR